jgi:hypothetical protein
VPDYTPVFLPGTKFTMQASGTIAGGDLLVVSGSGTVAKAAALAGLNYVGVAGHDAVSGAKVTVIAAKAVHESVADGGICSPRRTPRIVRSRPSPPPAPPMCRPRRTLAVGSSGSR